MHSKFPVVCFVIISITAVCFGAQTEWVKITSPEGRFSVSLPHEPKVEKDPDLKEVGNGRLITMEEGYGFVCEYYDVTIPDGSDIQQSLDATREGIMAGSKATKLGEKQISLDGAPGRELQISFKVDNVTEMAATIRFFLVGNRLYSLSYIRKQNLDEKVSAVAADRFFTSFKLIPK